MDEQTEFLRKVLKGTEDAVVFCGLLGEISQVLDDLVDGDKAVAEDEIERAFFLALIELPRNPFYARHYAALNPMIQAAFAAWQDANVLERGNDHDKTLAFVLRDMLTDVAVACAYLIGGYEWAREVGPDIRRFFHDETLGTYLREHAR